MLFDLQGRRRRVVQGTYLMLAILMGGGLVLFGIGGDVSGGLFDAFSDRNTGGNGNSAIEERIDRAEQRLERNPRDAAALQELVRANYQLATSQTAQGQVGFPDEARDELTKAATAWQRYLEAEERRPDPSLATVAFQIYDVGALNRPKEALQAAQIIAQADPESNAYIRVVQYATLAGNTRIANLAGDKAIELAPKGQRKVVRQQVQQAKAPAAPGAAQGAPAQGGAVQP
jgi:hypothetical protein